MFAPWLQRAANGLHSPPVCTSCYCRSARTVSRGALTTDDDGECEHDGGYTAKVEAAVLTAEELREERHAQPLLRELDVPAWQEVAVMRPRWRAMLKSIKIRTVR